MIVTEILRIKRVRLIKNKTKSFDNFPSSNFLCDIILKNYQAVFTTVNDLRGDC